MNGVDTVPVCIDIDSESWEEELFDNIGVEDEAKHSVASFLGSAESLVHMDRILIIFIAMDLPLTYYI